MKNIPVWTKFAPFLIGLSLIVLSSAETMSKERTGFCICPCI